MLDMSLFLAKLTTNSSLEKSKAMPRMMRLFYELCALQAKIALLALVFSNLVSGQATANIGNTTVTIEG